MNNHRIIFGFLLWWTAQILHAQPTPDSETPPDQPGLPPVIYGASTTHFRLEPDGSAVLRGPCGEGCSGEFRLINTGPDTLRVEPAEVEGLVEGLALALSPEHPVTLDRGDTLTVSVMVVALLPLWKQRTEGNRRVEDHPFTLLFRTSSSIAPVARVVVFRPPDQ